MRTNSRCIGVQGLGEFVDRREMIAECLLCGSNAGVEVDKRSGCGKSDQEELEATNWAQETAFSVSVMRMLRASSKSLPEMESRMMAWACTELYP